MKEEIQQHPREPKHDVEQRRMTERGNDPGTSEPGTPDRSSEPDRSKRMGPPQTTGVPDSLEGAPTEDSPAREPTEKVERMEEAAREHEERKHE